MFGYVLAMKSAQVIAVHDCDITTYNREMLTRLIYPVVHPGLDFKYSKGVLFAGGESENEWAGLPIVNHASLAGTREVAD